MGTVNKFTLLFNSKAKQGGEATESYWTSGDATVAQLVSAGQNLGEARGDLLGQNAVIEAIRVTQYTQDTSPNLRLAKLFEFLLYANTEANANLPAGDNGDAFGPGEWGAAGALQNDPRAEACIRTAGADATWYLADGNFSHSALAFAPVAVSGDDSSTTVADADTGTIRDEFQDNVAAFNLVLKGPVQFGRYIKIVPVPLQSWAVIAVNPTGAEVVMTVGPTNAAVLQPGVTVQTKRFRQAKHMGKDPYNGVWQITKTTANGPNYDLTLSGNPKACSGGPCFPKCDRKGYLYPLKYNTILFNPSIGPVQVKNRGRSKRRTAK